MLRSFVGHNSEKRGINDRIFPSQRRSGQSSSLRPQVFGQAVLFMLIDE